jgi:putative transposase
LECIRCRSHWRRTALDHIEELFVDGRTRKSLDTAADADRDALFEEIGRLKVELDFVKKKAACSSEDRRVLVDCRTDIR